MRRISVEIRPSKPELVEIGDKVSVELPDKLGISTTKIGVVHRRIDNGDNREYYTDKGGFLFRWNPKRSFGYKITILGSTPVAGISLFDF
jgi:hypothetical protein